VRRARTPTPGLPRTGCSDLTLPLSRYISFLQKVTYPLGSEPSPHHLLDRWAVDRSPRPGTPRPPKRSFIRITSDARMRPAVEVLARIPPLPPSSCPCRGGTSCTSELLYSVPIIEANCLIRWRYRALARICSGTISGLLLLDVAPKALAPDLLSSRLCTYVSMHMRPYK
jgi:hypothetical protein